MGTYLIAAVPEPCGTGDGDVRSTKELLCVDFGTTMPPGFSMLESGEIVDDDGNREVGADACDARGI
jgi:hypothetical protein